MEKLDDNKLIALLKEKWTIIFFVPVVVFLRYFVFLGNLDVYKLNYASKMTSNILYQWAIIVLISYIIARFINISIHNFGRFVIGKLLGYKLLVYSFGIFQWTHQNGKVVFSTRNNMGAIEFCVMVPPNKHLSNFLKAMYFSAGFMFELVFSMVFLFLSQYLKIDEAFRYFIFIVSFVGVARVLIHLVPFQIKGAITQAMIIWSLLMKEPIAEKLIEAVSLETQLIAGVRPKDLHTSIVSIDTEHVTKIDMIINLYLYFQALDSNNVEKMNKIIDLFESNIDLVHARHSNSVNYEMCYNACVNHDYDKARRHYDKICMFLQNDGDANGMRIKAYYEHYVNNHDDNAIKFCNDGLAVIHKFQLKSQAMMEKDLMIKLKNAIS